MLSPAIRNFTQTKQQAQPVQTQCHSSAPWTSSESDEQTAISHATKMLDLVKMTCKCYSQFLLQTIISAVAGWFFALPLNTRQTNTKFRPLCHINHYGTWGTTSFLLPQAPQCDAVSIWIWSSCKPHRITSGHSDSVISKCTLQNLSYLYRPFLESLHKTNPSTNIHRHQTNFQRVSPFNITPVKKST